MLDVKQTSEWRSRQVSAFYETPSIIHKVIEKKVLGLRASKAHRRAISDARRRGPFINSHLLLNNLASVALRAAAGFPQRYTYRANIKK